MDAESDRLLSGFSQAHRLKSDAAAVLESGLRSALSVGLHGQVARHARR